MSLTPYKPPILPEIKRRTYLELYRKGLRTDNRDLFSPRSVEIETGVIEKAEGSALVKLGDTQVLSGIKIEVGSPFKDTPDQGVLTVHAEYVPLASPIFEPGPPDENAIELARVVDRSLREVGVIDLPSLVIKPGERAWIVWVDLYILNHDGNLFDASMMAAMASLLDARLPDLGESGESSSGSEAPIVQGPLNIRHRVVTVTTAKIGDYIVVDPNFEEESIADTRLIIAFDERYNIVGAQKSGMGGLSMSELYRMMDVSREAAAYYFKALDEAFGR